MITGKKTVKTLRIKKERAQGIEKLGFKIVGIGASAGGLEALEQFFLNLKDECGMAFVIIQHLDPSRKGIMPELLQRVSTMQVLQAEDGMTIEPNNVYVLPPNKSMSVLHGKLHLFDPLETTGLRLPIDIFLNSLAEDQMSNAVGIILSGMGSDGSHGVKMIREKGVLLLVPFQISPKRFFPDTLR
jgi:two-component system CheB/CheR fusion protein